ncbi:MAG: ATP-binding cassette domain-containing protein [Nitrospiraceae bacterium]|nr:ATP-binding cassette domain-containing protein [Nitrospiraceae bacterium]
MELLRAESLKKFFEVRKTFRSGGHVLKAVDGIDFALREDSVLALVGESGCGKSTVARLVLRLMEPTSGAVLFKGKNIFSMDRAEIKAFRKSVQIIFQDPFASLNPRRTVYDTISEPLLIHRLAGRPGMKDAVVGVLEKVGLGAETLNRYPHEFSGGQRQRICIARALAVSPELIVADEPLSALDVSIQAQIINLLTDLKKQTKISFLFISHDLRVVQYFSDAVGVMYLGKIVEYAGTDGLFEKPFHPYTEVLLASAPKIRPDGWKKIRSAPLQGEVPSPINIPPGCPFHPRCPRRFEPCDRIVPELKESHGRLVSCHLWNPY